MGPRHQAWGPYLAEQYLPERSDVGVRLGSLLRCQPADCGRTSAQLPIADSENSACAPVSSAAGRRPPGCCCSVFGPLRPRSSPAQQLPRTAGRRGDTTQPTDGTQPPRTSWCCVPGGGRSPPLPRVPVHPTRRRRRRFPAAARAVCWPAADRPGQGRGGGEGRPAAVCQEH